MAASKATAKKTPTSLADSGKATLSQSSARANSVMSFIAKATDQKPIGLNESTFPHISSNVIQIDNIIGGSVLSNGTGLVCPGYPRGRLIELYGAESSGKTTLSLGAIVSVQRSGGLAMFLDFENTLHHGYARAIGVDFDPSKLLLYAPNNLEEGLKMMYIAIKQGVDLIVVDSVAAMVTKDEMEKKLDDPARIGALARAMSQNLPKMVQWLKEAPTSVMFLNQTRSLISKSSHGGDDDNTAGGKAVKFYASLRLKATRIRSDYIEKADSFTLKKKRIPFGNVVLIKVVKNKIDGRQGQTAEVFIRYGFGVDPYLSLIEGAIPRKIIQKSGSSYVFEGETFKGKEKVRSYLISNPKAYELIKTKVLAAMASEAPQPIDPEDLDEEDILQDMRKELGDDDLIDGGDEGAPEEALVEGE